MPSPATFANTRLSSYCFVPLRQLKTKIMKKIVLTLLGLICMTVMMQAQQFVLEGVGAQHVILEEFTGIKCGNCPAGHTEAANIQTANQGLVHVIALPPTNSSYTNPSGTAGTDFRRSFTDAFYTASYCSPANSNRFMPSAFVNRKLGADGNILQTRTNWAAMTTAALTETPDLNVAVKSIHDATANTLTVDVQVYYTSTVTNNNAIYVILTEDDLTSAYQSGSSATATSPYTYKHTFRENISAGQWGDAITGTTTQGSLFTKQYVFDLSTAIDPINIEKAHVVAYVVDATSTNKEVLNGISTNANGGTATTGSAPTAVNDLTTAGNVSIYPNPSTSDVFVTVNNDLKDVQLEVVNILGKTIYTSEIENNATLKIENNNFPAAGVYFIKLSNDQASVTKKVIVQ